jgi:hypothetical protein
MKKFTVPSAITPRVPGREEAFKQPDGTDVTVSFKEFCETCILQDPKWVRTFADIKAATSLSSQLDAPEVTLEDKDYDKLKEVAEAPSHGFQGYHPSVILQFVPYLEAILGAK